MSKIYKDVCHGIEYGDDGKRKWTKCGICIINGDNISIKLDYVPTNFDGWLNVFDQKKKDDTPF